MKEESLLFVKELKERIHHLFGEYEKLEEKNRQLQETISTLLSQVEVLEKEKADLGNRYENLKLAKTMVTGAGDARLVRLKMGKLMREIDKCVALLNE